MARDVTPGMKLCPYCAEEIRAEAIKCRYCGERLDAAGSEPAHTPAAPGPPQAPLLPEDPFQPRVTPTGRQEEPSATGARRTRVVDAALGDLPNAIYQPDYDLDSIPVETREQLMQHSLDRHVPVWLAVFASILTVNIFFIVNYSVKHGRLPRATRSDPAAAMALLLLFVPFVNLYWIFFMWWRLADRLNLQLRLRGMPIGPNHWLPVIAVLMIFGWLLGQGAADFAVFCYALNWLVIVPLFVSQLQRAINDLVAANAKA